MAISIFELEKTLKTILNDASIQSSDNVYEKIDDGYRLVIDLKNLFWERTNIIYTKLIFYTDENKTYLIPNKNNEFKFKYLYDLNCDYKLHIFNNLNEFEKMFLDIIKKNKFGNNLKILSNFIKSPGSLINNWFNDNNIRNISVYDIKLDERYDILPCKRLFFNFIINLNNQMNINLTLKKEDNTNYIYDFKIYDDTIEVDRPNLSTLIQSIGETIKSKYV
jgi:hypothetical protein